MRTESVECDSTIASHKHLYVLPRHKLSPSDFRSEKKKLDISSGISTVSRRHVPVDVFPPAETFYGTVSAK